MSGRSRLLEGRVLLTIALILSIPKPNAAHAADLTIRSPKPRAKITGQLRVRVTMKKAITSCNVYVDGTALGSSSPGSHLYELTTETSDLSPGNHVLLATGYDAGNQQVATSSVVFQRRFTPTAKRRRTPTPTATRTPKPTPSPTPSFAPSKAPTGTPTATTRSTATASMTATQIATPTATSTTTQTSTPARTATRTPTVTVTATSTATSPTSPTATPTAGSQTTYYVAPSGNDSNTGLSVSSAWKTIQHAADTVQAGDAAIVEAGNYPERVTVSSAGRLGAPIILEADAGATVTMEGFNIEASYVQVVGFEITTQANDNDGFGIYVTGNRTTGVLIQNNTIHDLCRDGIYLDPGVSNLLIQGNLIYRASMSGIMIEGTGTTVDSNEIWGTQQYPRLAGGVTASCTDQGGADADAIRFFGSNHVIKNNYLHDIQWGTTINPDPHIDCFQTWGNYDGSGGATSNILITGNHCVWPASSDSIDNEISSIEALSGSTTTGITYSYNVFSGMRNGIVIGSGVGTMVFDHNTVDHIVNEASLQFPGSATSASAVTNDIFYDCGTSGDSFATGSGFSVSNDDCIMRGGSNCGTYPSNYSHVSVDPQFVSDGTGSAPWLNANYHLQSSSTVQSMGACGTDLASPCPPPQ